MTSGVIELTVPVSRTARVRSVEAMFDVPATEQSRTIINYHLPLDEQQWQIGAIIGPSGCGKSTVGRALFGDLIDATYDWPTDGTLVDAFPQDMSTAEVTELLGSVGLSTVPAWLRPFHVLSNGEQFRATVARALAETRDTGMTVVDEFTSVVDRQVAKVASSTVAKSVRRDPSRRFVAISCHSDIVDWLQPDWIYQPATNEFTWRSVQPRPQLTLDIRPASKDVWPYFAPHHYLSHKYSGVAGWVGLIDERPVAFASVLVFPHPRRKNLLKGHRHVVLPDWQGLGIAMTMQNWLGLYLYERGWVYHNSIAHPGLIAALSRSPRWEHRGAANNGRVTTSVKAAPGLFVRSNKARLFGVQTFRYHPPAGTTKPKRKVTIAEWPNFDAAGWEMLS